MKFGILFSGQGAQYTNMGLDFMSDPIFASVITAASSATGLDLPQILTNEHDELNQTINVQPAIVAMSTGIFAMLKRDLPELAIGGALGLSLGEYSALIASQAIEFDQAMKLLQKRASYMQADSDQIATGMIAVLNPQLAKIQNLLANKEQVYLANYNTPKQIVIGGSPTHLVQVADEIKELALAKRVVELPVNGAFHTPFYATSSQKLSLDLAQAQFSDPMFPVVSNTTVDYFTGQNCSDVLAKQVCQPTHFGDCFDKLVRDQQITATLELGPGKTLTKFAKQIDRNLIQFSISNLAEYREFVEKAHER